MVGPSRPNNAAAAATTQQTAEMVTIPSSGASYPKFLEPLTKNETALLDMYEKIKHYEKEAARLKAEEAKRRLEEADERYRAKVREREKAEGGGSDNEEDADDEDRKAPSKKKQMDVDEDSMMQHNESEEEEEDQEAIEKRKKRDKEISKLREDVNAAQKVKDKKKAHREAAKQKEEALRRDMLGEGGEAVPTKKDKSEDKKRPTGNDEDENDTSDEEEEPSRPLDSFTGPSIKNIRKDKPNPWDDDKPKPSLIANLGGDTTPIHDFSKKLGMSKVSLDGSVLFPVEGHMPWEPPQYPSDFLDGCLELELPDFDPATAAHSGNNTIAIKFHVPHESKRFSINIASPNHDNYNDILFHFNPRHFQKGGQLVINDRKETRWGNDISVPLVTLPLIFGVDAMTLILQINDEGFDVFVDDVHACRLEHRRILPKGKGPLYLQFPSSDDYGNPENWMVYRVWWGRKASMVNDLNGVAGVNRFDAVHPKKLFITGLTKLRSQPEVDLRRAELERAFRKYGAKGLVLVSVQMNSSFAFVEVATEQQADLALIEMASTYRVNKARRTKHEVLMEQRAAKEAAEKGVTKETVDWD